MTFEKADEIYQELYQKAINLYAEKTEWDITEWLDDNDLKLYEKVRNIIFGY